MNHHTFIVTIYPPTGGAEGNIGSTTGGASADEIARHKEQVDRAGKKAKEERKNRAGDSDPASLDMQILRDELAAAEKGTERSEAELKKVRGLLAERTTEVKSMKQSMTVNNRARSESKRQLHIVQKQVAQLQKQMELLQKQSDQSIKSYNKVKEANRARIAELEAEIAEYSPLVRDLEGSAATLQDWSERDRLLRDGYFRVRDSQSEDGSQDAKLRVADELMEILRRYLVGPESEEQTSVPKGGPMVEEEEGQGEGEGATGLGGSTQGKDPAGVHGAEKRIPRKGNVLAETQSGQSSKKRKGSDVVTQMRPDEAGIDRLKQGLVNPTVRPKRLTKRQRKAAEKPDDYEADYGMEGSGVTHLWYKVRMRTTLDRSGSLCE